MKQFHFGGPYPAIALTAVGLYMLLFPTSAASLLGFILGGIFILYGLVNLILFFKSSAETAGVNSQFAFGIFCVAVGLFDMIGYRFVLSILPWVIGVMAIISGIYKLQDALLARKMKQGGTWMLVLALVNLALGAVLFFNPFRAVRLLFRIGGGLLIYSGVTDLISMGSLHGMKKRYGETIELREDEYKVR